MQQLNDLLKNRRATVNMINNSDKIKEILQEAPQFRYEGYPKSFGRHLLKMHSQKHDADFIITAYTPPTGRYRNSDSPLDISYVTVKKNPNS